MAITVRHWILPTYIGEEPAAPAPSAPRLVSELLQLPNTIAQDGAWTVSPHSHVLRPGDGASFKKWLESPDRILPVVYVSLNYPEGGSGLDADRIAELTAGAAHVVVAAHVDVDKELEWMLTKQYRCWNGMVRVYLPQVRFESSWDFKRHRFFSRRLLSEIGAAEAYDQIVRGVVRRGRSVFLVDDRLSIDTIEAKKSKIRLAELRESVGDSEELQLVWNEFEQLEAELAKEKALSLELLKENEALEAEARAASDKLTAEKWHWEDRASELEREATALKRRARGLEQLDSLPTTVPEVVHVLGELHGDRIAFTPRAMKSAADSRLSDPGVAWHCLWSVATELHELLFVENLAPEAICREFKDRTGYDVTFTEGKLTKRSKGIMASRIDTWNGEDIDITPHVKVGSEPPKLLRVHFCADRESQRLVIGHCGEHLDTSGTRRRS